MMCVGCAATCIANIVTCLSTKLQSLPKQWSAIKESGMHLNQIQTYVFPTMNYMHIEYKLDV